MLFPLLVFGFRFLLSVLRFFLLLLVLGLLLRFGVFGPFFLLFAALLGVFLLLFLNRLAAVGQQRDAPVIVPSAESPLM